MKVEPTIEPSFYVRTQVARKMNVSVSTIDNMRASGHFGVKHLQAGRKVLFPAAEVDEYLQASAEAGRFLTFDQWQERKARADK
jgi:excisionase family DNA binding protein